MKSTVFENWMDYVSDGQVEEFEEALEDMSENLERFGFGTGICDCGNVATFFEIHLEDGQEYSFPAYPIYEDTDGMDARDIVEANYEIYIGLLWKLYGIEAFKTFDGNVSFDDYLNRIIELIEIAYGKTQDTDDCLTCSMCLQTSEERGKLGW